ncbi:MAG: histidine kinase [Bdellovibrionales bacterium RIFCSPHIGHO2_01_FULL_40_29]|nr:MAG: histidine kinase [Bdellovibrionales bacterium RIFCSPHIGHO2_01_FULL_40_29]OFZ34200.1 MAG: histidine kinase [Bdellovibrionales bacterium RIFCSPHIGHO2_02_FULL_40_15]
MFNSNTKFLVVDDFSTMRKIIKKVLDEIGYKNVVEAVDGKNALEVIAESYKSGQPIQFVISDWNMPNMQGIELLRACKDHPDYKTLPFMLVTAESEQTQIIEAAKAGVSEYVVKPFNAATLKAKIERVYNKIQVSTEKKAA